MATKLVQSPIGGFHVFPSLSISTEFLNSHRPSSSTYPKPWSNNKTRLAKYDNQHWYFGTSSNISSFSRKVVQMEFQSEDDKSTVAEIKAQLHDSLEGINRGIFGMPSAKKTEIEELVKLLESKNPTIEPTEQLEKLAGTWKLVYSTITILGSKRTKLGLRDFISLGDFLQIINIAEEKAVNVIKFSARGFDMLSGQLQIDASFKIASKSRVEISYNGSSITPEQVYMVSHNSLMSSTSY
ncbi:hypothetical protein Leryth_002954 [Lithospermum erythrorhizon]|nr:hypothetical protein Leryth_002954 [Lithospermum erythrorhizon]